MLPHLARIINAQLSIGSLDVENFFGCITEMSCGRGVVKSTQVDQLLSAATEILVTKLDTSKSFSVHTCKSTVYPNYPALDVSETMEDIDPEPTNTSKPRGITFRYVFQGTIVEICYVMVSLYTVLL